MPRFEVHWTLEGCTQCDAHDEDSACENVLDDLCSAKLPPDSTVDEPEVRRCERLAWQP